MPNNYAVSRASILLPAVKLLDEYGVDPSVTLNKMGQIEQLIKNSNVYLPSYALGHVLAASSYQSGVDAFSFMAGSSDDFSDIHPNILAVLGKETCLFRALSYAIELQSLQGSHFSLGLELNTSGFNIFHTSALPSDGIGFASAHLFTTARILKIVRHFLGSNWQPSVLGFEPSFCVPAIVSDNTASMTVFTGLKRSYIPIPGDVEKLSLPFERNGFALPSNNVSRVKNVMRALVQFDGLSLDRVAHLFGTSERTIQRAFHDQGESYRGYLNYLKANKAKDLLTRGHTISEVADILNYSDTSNFTRALKKQTGLTPSQIVRATRFA